MKHYISMAAVFAWATVSIVPAAAQQARIAVVDFERAVVESNEGKKGQEDFNRKLEEWRTKIEAAQAALTDAQNKLQTQDRVLSATARAEATRDIERRQTELTRMNEDAQRDLDAVRQQLLAPVLEKAQEILNAYAAREGFTMVIDLSSPQSNVVFRSAEVDITDRLIEQLNALSSTAAPATTPTPAASAPAATAP